MAPLIYNLGVRVYGLLIRLSSPFYGKAQKLRVGRKQALPAISKKFAHEQSPVAWFHCASLGEFEQARPLIETFKAVYPSYKILLTFFSPSGYEVRKHYPAADLVTYLPADTAAHAHALLDALKPKVVFFVKYEFWHHYAAAISQRKIPFLSVSAIFRPQQIFFKPYGGFYRKILRCFDHIFVQDPHSAALLRSIGLQRITESGDTRFDRVKAIYEQRREVPIAARFATGHRVLVAGSTWPADLAVLGPTLDKFPGPLKLIMAPHEISESNVAATIAAFPNRKALRYSEAEHKNLQEYDLLIIDNMGMLSSLYAYGEFAWIGGAYGKGLHNTLEAATYGIPVFFGKKYDKFREAMALVDLGGAFSVLDAATFGRKFNELYHNEPLREKAGKTCKAYVQQNTGATQLVMDFLQKMQL